MSLVPSLSSASVASATSFTVTKFETLSDLYGPKPTGVTAIVVTKTLPLQERCISPTDTETQTVRESVVDMSNGTTYTPTATGMTTLPAAASEGGGVRVRPFGF
ncbi:hypothetical protein Q5752_000969 [Cryptotrichosporon argae]